MQKLYSDRSMALLTKDQWMEEHNSQQAANTIAAHKQTQAAAYVSKEITANEEESTNQYDEDLDPEELGDKIAALITRKFRKQKWHSWTTLIKRQRAEIHLR